MKKFVVFGAAVVLFSACNFGFMNKTDEGVKDTSVLKTEISTFKDLEIRKIYKYSSAEVANLPDAVGDLQYIEQYWVENPETDSRRVNQIQHFSASGDLVSTKMYTYGESDLVESYSFYNSNNKLQSVFTYEYSSITVDSEIKNVLKAQHEYTVTDLSVDPRKGSLLFQYVDSGLAAGETKAAAYFGSNSEQFDDCVRWYFLPESATWNMKVSSVTGTSSVVSPSLMSVPYAGSAGEMGDSTDTDRLGAKTGITEVPLPAFPILDMPVFEDLKNSQYSFQYKDEKGSSFIEFDTHWYPTEVIRADSRLSDPVKIRVEHDSSGRITSKKTYFGSTLALELVVSYDDTSRPVSIEASGAAMKFPLTFALGWLDSSLLSKITVSINGVDLQYFAFEYKDGFSVSPDNFERPSSIDPFSLVEDLFGTLESLLSSEVVIRNYDSEENLIQTFVFESVETGAKIIVYKPADGVENLVENTINGFYSITYTDGLASKISAFNKESNEVWSREFGYDAAFFTKLAESADIPNAEDLQDLADNAVALYETNVPSSHKEAGEEAVMDSATYLSTLSENIPIDVMLDILF